MSFITSVLVVKNVRHIKILFDIEASDRIARTQPTELLIIIPNPLFTNVRFTNFRDNEPREFIPLFSFTNIVFATTKNQASSEVRTSASKVTQSR